MPVRHTGLVVLPLLLSDLFHNVQAEPQILHAESPENLFNSVDMSAIPTFRPSNLNNLPQAEVGEAGFSRLEASLVSTNVVPRPNSRKTDDVHRHAEKGDLNVNELDFDYSLSAKDYPLSNLRSLQQAFKRVQFHKHIVNNQNYSNQTSVEFLEVNIDGGGKVSFTDKH